MKNASIILCAILLQLVTTTTVNAQDNAPDSVGKSCETFLKEFYRWYLTRDRATPPRVVYALEITLKSRPAVLSEQLIRGIKAVDTEAEKSQDAGLDFEPILNTQDPGDLGDPPYLVRDVKVTAGACRADVYCQSTTGKSEKIVIPELHARNGRWIFTNFHYPNFPQDPSSNLVSIIENYLKDSKMGQK